FYRLPDNRDLAAQYLLLYEMSLPFGFDLNDRINIDKSATRLVVRLSDITTTELRAMEEKAKKWLAINESPGFAGTSSSLSLMWAHISERNINNMLGAAFGALVLISLILIFALRDVRLGLLSLVPNLAPAVIGFGIWGLTFGTAGLGLSVVAAMTLGIVVDDTVHFMSKYLRARREHQMDPADAVRYSFRTVGAAMCITTVALTAGFAVLSFSGYKMSSDMGLLTALTISLALVLDFFFLPTLLLKVDREKQPSLVITKEKTNETVNFDSAVVVPVDSKRVG
ncbi:MAG: efflux RND transporter permease subunit, partial [candidate division Zixibacteria bacterium]|nr:efflux RND transporter permease subunit [candidate division Zixibacteria bacterium]